MGLDVSHDAFHGLYSSFGHWRNIVAEAAGYKIVQVPYDDTMTFPAPSIIMHERWTLENFQGDWDEPPEDPLLFLLVHSDTDGHIEPNYCLFLAKRLEQLLPDVDKVPNPGRLRHWGDTTRQFIAGLIRAHEAGEPLELG